MSTSNFFKHSPPVFIMGTQRSGTTLLTKMMSSHPNIHIQNELPLRLVFTDDCRKDTVLENFDKLYHKRYSTNIAGFMSNHKKDIWGLKDPQLTEHIVSLRQFLPDSKFIFIVRDPRAVVNSYIDNKWGLGTTAYTGVKRWCEEVLAQDSFLEEMGNNGLHLRYEDLVKNTEATLKTVCKHLSLQYSDDMLKSGKQTVRFSPNRSNANTNQQVTSSFASKWKLSLSRREVEEIESLAKPLMIKHGYPLETNAVPPSKFRQFYYNLHQIIVGELQIQYQLKRVRLKALLAKVLPRDA